MSKVTINDETSDAAAGDNILKLARRMGAHVWFVCDGRGLCRSCECRVISGADQLSPPTKMELGSLTDSRRFVTLCTSCSMIASTFWWS